jgi:hypothetical protein
MKYYSIHNVFLVAISKELGYIATLVSGTLKSEVFRESSLLEKLCVSMGDEIKGTVFESLIAVSTSSKDAEELLTYFKVKENTKDGNIS